MSNTANCIKDRIPFSFMDLKNEQGCLYTKIYDKREDLDFNIVYFPPFLDGVCISQRDLPVFAPNLTLIISIYISLQNVCSRDTDITYLKTITNFNETKRSNLILHCTPLLIVTLPRSLSSIKSYSHIVILMFFD